MTPHLVKWHEKYAAQGLTIIDVDNGRMDPIDAVRGHVHSERLPFVVLHDTGGAVCDAYGVEGYPTAYLIDRKGNIAWQGNPIASPAGCERMIEQALAEGI